MDREVSRSSDIARTRKSGEQGDPERTNRDATRQELLETCEAGNTYTVANTQRRECTRSSIRAYNEASTVENQKYYSETNRPEELQEVTK